MADDRASGLEAAVTLVERVARAIADQIGPTYDEAYENKADWIDDRGKRADINAPRRSDYRDAARAAIEAMQRPTEKMVADMLDALRHRSAADLTDDRTIIDIYTVGIAAALSEEP